jgi:hypothetical protein
MESIKTSETPRAEFLVRVEPQQLRDLANRIEVCLQNGVELGRVVILRFTDNITLVVDPLSASMPRPLKSHKEEPHG